MGASNSTCYLETLDPDIQKIILRYCKYDDIMVIYRSKLFSNVVCENHLLKYNMTAHNYLLSHCLTEYVREIPDIINKYHDTNTRANVIIYDKFHVRCGKKQSKQLAELVNISFLFDKLKTLNTISTCIKLYYSSQCLIYKFMIMASSIIKHKCVINLELAQCIIENMCKYNSKFFDINYMIKHNSTYCISIIYFICTILGRDSSRAIEWQFIPILIDKLIKWNVDFNLVVLCAIGYMDDDSFKKLINICITHDYKKLHTFACNIKRYEHLITTGNPYCIKQHIEMLNASFKTLKQ